MQFVVMMKDSNASLSHYGLKSGSRVMMLGDKSFQSQAAPPQHNNTSNNTTDEDDIAIKKIHNIVDELMKNISDYISIFKSESATFLNTSVPLTTQQVESTTKSLKMQHARISEVLLQGLLKLDGIKCPPPVPSSDNSTGEIPVDVRISSAGRARAERKAAVNKLNVLLAEMDAIKDKILKTANNKL